MPFCAHGREKGCRSTVGHGESWCNLVTGFGMSAWGVPQMAPAVGAGKHSSCTVGSDAVSSVGTTVSCRCVRAIVAMRSLINLQCLMESALSASTPPRGVSIAIRLRIFRPLSGGVSKLEASLAYCCRDQFAVEILFGSFVLFSRERSAWLSFFLRCK